jgi:hypothetical protein
LPWRSRASGCWWRRCKVSDVQRLAEAPDFKLNVAIGDSLLHGKRFGMTATEGMFEGAEHYAGHWPGPRLRQRGPG